jgi:hypothetical protein
VKVKLTAKKESTQNVNVTIKMENNFNIVSNLETKNYITYIFDK